MAYGNLGEFVSLLEAKGELKRIGAEVDPRLEISQIVDRICKTEGPALLFERVKGSELPLLINAFGSTRRMAWALGVEDLKEITSRLQLLLEVEIPRGILQKLKLIPKYARLARYIPEVVKKGDCQEVKITESPSLEILPALQCWPQDAGRFITLPQVFTKSLKDGRRNVGMYRMQIFDAQRAGLHWHIHHDGALNFREHQQAGKTMEVAVSLGGDPAVIYASTAPLPPGIDELLLAGFLRDKKVPLVKCQTIDMEVPADAEIVLEGYVEPSERAVEGPFGDHRGYYSLPHEYPVFHLTCITHRRSPIYPATLVGKPPMEDAYLGKASERLFLPLLRSQLPEVVDLNLPVDAGFHNLAIVSIDKRYPFHARKVMHSLWGLGQMMFTKVIVVVDAEVDVHNPTELLWKVGNSIDPRRDVCFVEGPIDVLDHASAWLGGGSKMGIDATRKWKEEGFEREWPEVARMSPEVVALVERRWREYGID